MKITTGYLVSLALNAVLGTAVLVLAHEGMPRAEWAGGNNRRAAARPEASPGSAHRKLPTAVIGGGWRNWIDPLRRAGVPDDVLAGLVRADFDRRWRARQADAQQRYMQGRADADSLAALAIEHDVAVDNELRAALGPEAFRRWDMEQILQGLNVGQAGLSAQEKDAVYDLERGLRDELRNAQLEKLQGGIDQATENQREQGAQDAVAQRLRALLGDQRAGALQGADDTMGNLERSLGTQSLAKAQMEALAEAQRQWDQSRSTLVSLETATQDPAYADLARSGEQQWRDEFLQIAGPAAFDRFQKAQDSRYADLQRYAPEWGLSPADAEQVYATISDCEEAVAEYGQDARGRDVDPAAAQASIGAFVKQTALSLQESLGAARFGQLERNGIVPVAAAP